MSFFFDIFEPIQFFSDKFFKFNLYINIICENATYFVFDFIKFILLKSGISSESDKIIKSLSSASLMPSIKKFL